MGEQTAIEWTDHTFNPWWGCTKVSPGCANCYAESFDKRLGGNHWGPAAPRRTFGDKHWNEPLKWNAEAERAGRRARVFCASMADVFDADAPEGALARLWALIRQTPSLDWQLLTKRPERIQQSLPLDWGSRGYANVWLGTSVEDQKRADERVPVLAQVPARVRFLSCEPLLGAVDLTRIPVPTGKEWPGWADLLREHVQWVIAGGESGPHARPMRTSWVRSLRDQCAREGVAFLFKQWGEWLPISQDDRDFMEIPERCASDFDANDPAQGDDFDTWHRVGKKRAGRLLDGRTHDEFPRVAA